MQYMLKHVRELQKMAIFVMNVIIFDLIETFIIKLEKKYHYQQILNLHLNFIGKIIL